MTEPTQCTHRVNGMQCTRPNGHSGWHIGKPIPQFEAACQGEDIGVADQDLRQKFSMKPPHHHFVADEYGLTHRNYPPIEQRRCKNCGLEVGMQRFDDGTTLWHKGDELLACFSDDLPPCVPVAPEQPAADPAQDGHWEFATLCAQDGCETVAYEWHNLSTEAKNATRAKYSGKLYCPDHQLKAAPVVRVSEAELRRWQTVCNIGVKGDMRDDNIFTLAYDARECLHQLAEWLEDKLRAL